jgi:hypothetical protein
MSATLYDFFYLSFPRVECCDHFTGNILRSLATALATSMSFLLLRALPVAEERKNVKGDIVTIQMIEE